MVMSINPADFLNNTNILKGMQEKTKLFCHKELLIKSGGSEVIENVAYPFIDVFHNCAYTIKSSTGSPLLMKCENMKFKRK